MWDIVRTKPAGTHLGKAVPVFINNMQHHLTVIKAFADGAIDVWGFLDLALFDQKLKTGWVSTAPPRGSRINIFNLGLATAEAVEWQVSVEDIRQQVHVIVHSLNPEMRDLVDMEGSPWVMQGKVTTAKMGLPNDKPFRTTASGARILGEGMPVFERQGADLLLRRWFVFADGLSMFGPSGNLEDFGTGCERLASGEMTTAAKDGQWITIPGLGRFKAQAGNFHTKPGERVREARDLLDQLNGGKGAIGECFEAMNTYRANPSPENKQVLRAAYDRVPDHLKMYCGDMNTKDWEIRQALGEDGQPENPGTSPAP